MNQRYDFYADMLETHTEIGYLLVIAISLLAFNAAISAVLWRWPGDDVYLVPGVEGGGMANVTWGAAPPPIREAEPHDPLEGTPTIDLTPAPPALVPEAAAAPSAAAADLPSAAKNSGTPPAATATRPAP